MDNEITQWINQLTEQSPEAAEKIWNLYYDKLVQYASRKLGASPRRDADEEDIALSAIHSLYRGIQAGRFPKLENRDDLWKLLLTITYNKARKRIRYQMTQKRGAGAIRGESVFMSADSDHAGLAEFAVCEPTQEFAELVGIECEEMLEELGDDLLKQIALLKLQGYTNQEIAEQQGCAVRSIERKLNRIRGIWSEAGGASTD